MKNPLIVSVKIGAAKCESPLFEIVVHDDKISSYERWIVSKMISRFLNSRSKRVQCEK